jgi:glyoxylase-like metal-dependent hydrolase (beta-lactamase superfamily II)
MQVYRIPVLSDNYIFLLHDPDRNIAAVVDPAQAEPVLQQVRSLGAELTAIFNTHHHSDHVGGNQQLIARFPQIKVYGGAQDRGRIPGQQVFLQAGDRVEFADRTAEVFFVPGHTKAHIAYYFPAHNQGETGELFCGDTLFAGGCGRLFEGTPAQMLASLEQLRNLPDSTRRRWRQSRFRAARGRSQRGSQPIATYHTILDRHREKDQPIFALGFSQPPISRQHPRSRPNLRSIARHERPILMSTKGDDRIMVQALTSL